MCLEEGIGHPLHPCGHGVCTRCITRWMDHGGDNCPLCRRFILGIAEAPEAPETSETPETPEKLDAERIVEFPTGTHAGVTLANSRKGVRILRVDARDRVAKSGLKRGVVVTHINSIPIHSHERAIRFFNMAAEENEPLFCRIGSHRDMKQGLKQGLATLAALARVFFSTRITIHIVD